MTRDEAVTLIRESLNGLLADAAGELLLPGVSISTSKSGNFTEGWRFGGLPNLPKDVAWPRWDAREMAQKRFKNLEAFQERVRDPGLQVLLDRERLNLDRVSTPLAFLGCVELRAIASTYMSIDLPQSGLLFFFYDVKNLPTGSDAIDRGGCRVIYCSRGGEELTPPPEDLEKDEIFESVALRFEPEWTMPSTSVYWAKGEQEAAWEAVSQRLNGERDKTLHRLGGWPTEIQGRMDFEVELAANGKNVAAMSPAEKAELTDRAKEWKLLIQIDSDDNPGWMWGDAGRLYFWARDEDMRRGNFDNVWCIMQHY